MIEPIEPIEPVDVHDTTEAINLLIDSGEYQQIEALLAELHAGEVATVIESLPNEQRQIIWPYVPADKHADILAEVGDEVLLTIVEEMPSEELIAAASNMDSNDLALIIEELPTELGDEIKASLDDDILERLETNLTFEEGTAGRLMSGDFITVRSNVSVSVVGRYLRIRKTLPENTDCLMVINREGTYLGKLPLQNLLTADEDELVSDVMQEDEKAVSALMEESEIANYFEDRDLLSVAVVDENQLLLGRITVDDVLDILREQATHAVMSGSGLDDDADLFAPVKRSVRSRSLWLGINLVTALLASWVIGVFEATIEQIVALAVLMPIVASMGGIAGSQTLALIMRGQALNQISPTNQFWLLKKEISIGLLNGGLWALVIALVAGLWFQSLPIGLIIGVAIVVNLVAAAFAGFAVPMSLKKLGIDPAISAPVVLTTVTDVVGFFAFLGLATIFLI